MTPELQIRVTQWRAKAVAGTLSIEDMAEAAVHIREGRKTAAATSAGATTKRAKAAGPKIDGDSLLDEMMG